MGARQQLADALKAALPTKYKIIPYPRKVDELSANQPVVIIIRDAIEHAPNQGNLKETFVLWALTPKKDQPGAEDDLDDILFSLVEFVDTSKMVATWTKATRAIYGEQAQAYRIDITVHTEKEY